MNTEFSVYVKITRILTDLIRIKAPGKIKISGYKPVDNISSLSLVTSQNMTTEACYEM